MLSAVAESGIARYFPNISNDSVDFCVLVDEVGNRLRKTVPAAVRLICNFPDTCWQVAGNPDGIERVIRNLFVNSLQAIGDHPGSFTIFS